MTAPVTLAVQLSKANNVFDDVIAGDGVGVDRIETVFADDLENALEVVTDIV